MSSEKVRIIKYQDRCSNMKNIKNKKFKAIFFDKDGVLLDSVNDCLSAFNDTLKHYGEKELNKDEYLKEYLGFKAESNINKIFNYSTKIERKKILYHYMKKRAENKDTTKLLALWKVSVKDGMHSPTCYVVLAKSRIDAIGLATARYLGESKSNEIYSVTIENIKGRIVDV